MINDKKAHGDGGCAPISQNMGAQPPSPCAKITLVVANDILRVLDIEKEAFSPPWSYESLLSEIDREDSYFIVAVDDKNVVAGFAIMRQVGDDGELLKIAVDGSMRGRGIGDILMSDVLKQASAKKYVSVFLEVRSGNTAAVRLYEKHGFKTVRVRKDYYDSPVEDAVVMVRSTGSNV